MKGLILNLAKANTWKQELEVISNCYFILDSGTKPEEEALR